MLTGFAWGVSHVPTPTPSVTRAIPSADNRLSAAPPDPHPNFCLGQGALGFISRWNLPPGTLEVAPRSPKCVLQGPGSVPHCTLRAFPHGRSSQAPVSPGTGLRLRAGAHAQDTDTECRPGTQFCKTAVVGLSACSLQLTRVSQFV